jgi:RNA polymerase sigma-B factor
VEPSPRRLHDDALETLHLHYALTRDPATRDELVEAYTSLVQTAAGRFRGRGESFEDLVQVGYIGLLRALDRFDPQRGFPFVAYALPTILGEIRRHFRDQRWKVRVPRSVQERYLDVRAARDDLTQALARPPTVADIADALHLTVDEVVEAAEAGATFTPAGPELLEDESGRCLAAVDPGYEAVDNALLARSLIRRLPEWQQEIVELRFAEELTQSEIGERIGVCQMRVSRVLSRIIASLRDDLATA